MRRCGRCDHGATILRARLRVRGVKRASRPSRSPGRAGRLFSLVIAALPVVIGDAHADSASVHMQVAVVVTYSDDSCGSRLVDC